MDGHGFDLEALLDLFAAGDPRVVLDGSDVFLESHGAMEDEQGGLDYHAAQRLLRRVNGIGRALCPGFRPVRLTNDYILRDGSHVSVALAQPAESRARVGNVTVAVDGVVTDAPAPKGPSFAELALHDADVEDALRVLGQPDDLDWYDVYKACEIVTTTVGGIDTVTARGWATRRELERLRASANHPGISGDAARHSRMQGTPGRDKAMTLDEAKSLVCRLVSQWIESRTIESRPE